VKRIILVATVFFAFAINALAIPYTWVDTIDISSDKNISIFESASYSDIFTDNGFTSGEDTIYSYNRGLKLYDTRANKIMGNSTFINQPGTSADKTTPFLFELTKQILGWSLEGVVQLNKIGPFDNNMVSTKLGDYRLDSSELKAYGNKATPVPEPGAMVMFGLGLLGLAIYGKRRMNKEG
jgi:hypothetical protein